MFLNLGITFFVPSASEKMLKAWQENEEKAAAFTQVLPSLIVGTWLRF